MLPGAATLAFLDVDSCQRRVFGPAKQGAAFGHTKIAGKSLLVRGLNALVGTRSTPQAAPVIVGIRLRGGNAGSARGAASFVAEAITAARHAGATATLIVRADSAYYSGAFVAACRRAGARFSVTTPIDKKIHRTVAEIPDTAWTPIRYPRAVWDETNQAWVSDAEIAEVGYTAFASGRHRIDSRLIVRRVRDQNTTTSQGELFPAWRYHTVFTDSPFLLAQAEAQYRDHAIVEQVLADLADGPLAHPPSGVFTANAAWLTLAATAHNLLRAAGTLASAFHARARGATLRTHLVNIPARHGRGHITLHLPAGWHAEHPWHGLFTTTGHPPPVPATTTRAGCAATQAGQLEGWQVAEFTPFDSARKYASARVRNPDGAETQVAKGAVQAILARTRGPFYSHRPSRILLGAVVGTQVLATAIALTGLLMTPVGWNLVGLAWGWVAAEFVLLDQVKLAAYRTLEHHGRAVPELAGWKAWLGEVAPFGGPRRDGGDDRRLGTIGAGVWLARAYGC